MPTPPSDAAGRTLNRATIAVGLLIALAAGAWFVTERWGSSTRRLQTSLFERLDTASIHWQDETPPADGISLVSREAGPLVRLRLAGRREWTRVFQGGQHGLRNTELLGWRLPLDLPTRQAESVRVEQGDSQLPAWRAPRAPQPFGTFYSNSGFLARGLYIALPAGVHPGTLELDVLFAPGTDLLHDLLGPRSQIADLSELVGWVRAGVDYRKALSIPNRAAVEIPVSVPEAGTLVFWSVRRPFPWVEEPESTSLVVEVNAGAAWEEVGRIEFSPPPEDAEEQWSRAEIDLEEWEDRDAKLRFRVPQAAGVGRVGHYIAAPILVTARSQRQSPNLLVVTVDGLRADLHPWEMGSQSLTPNLAALASRGLAFTQARSAAPWTRASVASFFTGQSPLRHGVDSERDGARLPNGVPTLASTLASHGYATELLSANPHLDPAFGLAEGFAGVTIEIQDGSTLTQRVLESLAERAHDPFFLFAFYMDTHAPWQDRPEYTDADGIEARLRNPQLLGMASGRTARGVTEPTPQEVAKLRALYEENVRYVDAQIGELVAGLQRMDLADDTILVVTADHGEAFGEHGDFFHGWNVYDELSHVPLIVAGPGIPRGQRVDKPVSLMALPGLLMHWAGIEEDSFRMDPSTEEILRDERPDQATLMTTRFRDTQADALLRWPWKLIRKQGEIELYDLEDDPREKHDRAGDERMLTARLHRELQRRMADERAQRQTLEPAETAVSPDSATSKQLEALGYIGGP